MPFCNSRSFLNVESLFRFAGIALACFGLCVVACQPATAQATSIKLTSVTPTLSQLGQAVTITASVTPASKWSPIVFYDGINYLGVGGQRGDTITFTTSFLPAGVHNLRAYGVRKDTAFKSNVLTQTVMASAANGFAPVISYPVGAAPKSVKFGDLNALQNSVPDMVVANSSSDNVTLRKSDGKGVFGKASSIVMGNGPRAVAISDFSKDGTLDIFTANYHANSVSLRHGTASGEFTDAYTSATGSGPVDIVLSDVDQDGTLDVITANSGANSVSVLLGKSTGELGAKTDYPVGTAPSSVRVADLDHDGRPDLVVANSGSNSISVLLGTATGFAPAVTYSVGSAPMSVETADFNGDGFVDVVTADSSSGAVSVLIGNGDGTLLAATEYSVGTNPVYVATGDFNGDGKLDIVAANSGSKNISILLGTGDGTFKHAKSYLVGDGPSSIAVGEFNGDGRTDLAIVNSDDDTVAVLFGTASADLAISVAHAGSFRRLQTGATYTITVANAGAISTNGSVSVLDNLPSGLTATGIGGDGWSCTLETLTCTRQDALAPASSYPPITLVANVADDAPALVSNSATVSTSGDSDSSNNAASDETTILANADLGVTLSHSGSFQLSQVGATYSVVVANNGPTATSGVVTVQDILPADLKATAMAGAGWTCALETTTCTRADSIPSGTAFPPITLTINVAGNAAARVTNMATVSSSGDLNPANDSAEDLTTVLAIVAQAPTVAGVTPNSANGLTQTFAFQYASVNGYEYISWVQGVIVSGAPNYRSGCSFHYNRAVNEIYLQNDEGTKWVGPYQLGASATISNSQCSIHLGASSVAGTGNSLTLNLKITASSTFSGILSLYGYAADYSGLTSGWTNVGSWTPNAVVKVPPSVTRTSVTSAIAGVPQSIAFRFFSPNGAGFINWIQAMIGGTYGYANSCTVYFQTGSNLMYLSNDAGTGWAGSAPLGSAKILQNNQCTIDAANSTLVLDGNNFTLNVATTFSSNFVGSKTIWGYARDKAGLSSEWQPVGTFNVQ